MGPRQVFPRRQALPDSPCLPPEPPGDQQAGPAHQQPPPAKQQAPPRQSPDYSEEDSRCPPWDRVSGVWLWGGDGAGREGTAEEAPWVEDGGGSKPLGLLGVADVVACLACRAASLLCLCSWFISPLSVRNELGQMAMCGRGGSWTTHQASMR
ncbi:hypothetical protein HPB50_028036 [Hyalomma asiaticum]|nr:hypothetical protein HPB50_028036 [Hyalomma asiaticum]